MFVLDTAVVGELRKVRAGRADPGVARWAGEQPSALLFVSVITLHELECAVLRTERTDAAASGILRRWLDDSVAAAFAGRVLPVDEIVARRAAAWRVSRRVPLRDALLGATASVNGMALVTPDEQGFARFDGLDVVNPWS